MKFNFTSLRLSQQSVSGKKTKHSFFSGMRRTTISCLMIVLLVIMSNAGWGQLLQWNTFGNTGTETTEPSVSNNANIAASNLTLGSGVTPAANGNRFGGNNWWDAGNTATTTLAEAIADNDYIEFIVTPNAGFSFTPTSFVFNWDRSGTGPANVALRSSADGFAADLGSVTGLAASLTTGNTITISGLTGLATATTFRLYGYGATSAAGTGGFDVTTNVVNVQLNGTTATITDLYVNDNSNSGDVNGGALGNDAGPGTQLFPFLTIQEAVSVAPAGTTIHVDAGTYTETGQIVISDDLTIIGAGKLITIIKPAQNTTNSGDGRAWFLVDAGIAFNLNDVTLDGTGTLTYWGIKHYGSGTIDDCNFTEIKYEESGPAYQGTAVAIESALTVNVTNCGFTEIGRNGILADQCLGTYSGNTYTGKGAGDWLDYFILSEYGDNVTISNNIISNCLGIASTDQSGSSAIAVWDDPGTQAIISGNTLTDNTIGVAIVGLSGGTDPKVVFGAGNLFDGGDYGITFETFPSVSYTPDVTFTGVSTFKGQINSAIYLFDGASSGTTIDISAQVFKTAGNVVITNNFTKEDLVVHTIDAPNRGLLIWNPSNVYVTPNSFVTPTTTTASVQRGINAAGATGWTVNVQSGTTYTGGADASGKDVTLSPGASPGCVTITGNMILGISDVMSMELNGTTACTLYDQFSVNGTVTLGGATLSLSLGYVPSSGDQFTLINNDGGDAVVGQFAQGSTITVGGYTFSINYAGGDGNDVVLTSCGAGTVHNTITGLNYCTIQAAIDASATTDGDVITVDAGTYNENQILIYKAVSITGAGLATTTIDGGSASISTNGLVRITASGPVTFSGFTVKNAGGPSSPGDGGDNKLNVGIYTQSGITGVTYTISNNKILGTNDANDGQDYGFYSHSGKESLVFTNNEITQTGANAVLLEKHEGPVDVSNNSLNAGAYGVDAIFNMTYGGLDISALHKFSNNTIDLSTGTGSDNASGVTIASSFNSALNGNGKFSNIQVTDNTITGLKANRRGITLWNGTVGAGTDGTISDPVITGNTITGIGATTANCRAIQLINLVSNATITNNAISAVNQCFRGFTFAPGTGIATGTAIHNNSFTDFTELNWAGATALDATCNWYGTTVPATIASLISGTVNYTPWLTSGVDVSASPGFQPAPNTCSGCPSGNVVQNTNTLEFFCSIQEAIDAPATLNGHTITAGAGTYAENVIVNKSVTILGPNATINPCSGTRVAEAIVVPATAAIASGEIFHVAASNVTIKGFTIDGDNTAILSGFTSTNGADIDAAEGVTVYETGVNNLTVSNNIIKNLSYYGVTLYDYLFGVPSSGHVISNNKIQDLGTYDVSSGINLWGGGVLLYNNQYAAVTNNCMTNVRLGVQTGNFYLPNPGAATYQSISNNTIQARRRGIFHNLFYGTASPFTLSTNTITAGANANETTTWQGILLSSMQSVASTASGNIINGTAATQATVEGIDVWNCQVAPLISGGTITGVQLGINVNNLEGYDNTNGDNTSATIDGVTITSPSIAGIKVHDNPANSNGATVFAEIKNSSITGGNAGIWVKGSDASANIHDNASTITGALIGVDVDGGTATVYRNTITANGKGVRVINGGQLTPTSENFITNNTSEGIRIESSAGSIGAINSNDLSGNTGFNINNLSATSINATCNWHGTNVPASVALKVSGPMTYIPYLSTGVDASVSTNGFQPNEVCGACALILSTSFTPASCPNGNDGTATVTVASGGTAPYIYSWTTVPVQTTATATGLAAGTYSVTVTDVNGCTATTSVTVTANADLTPPTITCPANITVNNTTNQCGANVTYTATATDNCPGVIGIVYSPASGSSFPVGTTTTVTATATDANVNTASCTFTVTVVDAQNPTITCPANITVNNDPNQCGANVSFNATANDNCPGTTISYSPASGSFFPVGTATVTATATDAAGHTASCAFTVTVIQTQTANCPPTECQAPVITNVSSKSGITILTHSLTGVPAGALLVLTTTNNTNSPPYNCIVTSTPSLTWTKRVDAGATSSNNAEIWTAVYAAGGSITVKSDWGVASQASVLYTVLGAEPVLGGASGTAVSQSAPLVPVTTTRANSVLFGCTSDWNGIDGAVRVLRDAATDQFYFRNAAKGYTTYFYTKGTTAIGTYTEGVQSPTGQRAATAVLEIRCPGTPDNTAPIITAVTPLNGATNVATNTTVTATFNEAMNPATINGTTFELRDPSSALISATVTYNAGTNTAILTPSSALANVTTYTAKVIGGAAGVKDLAGNPMVGDYTWTFTTGAAPACQLTVLSVDTKTNTSVNTHSLSGVPAGALLVLTTTNNTNVPPYNCIVTSVPSLTWTKRVDAGATSSNNAEIWTTVYAAGGSISVKSDWGVCSQASVVYVVTGAESVLGGASGIGTSQSAPSVSVTTTRANSILFGCTSDWNGIDGAARVLRDAATDRFYFRNPAKGYTAYYYTKATTATGVYTEGVQSPTGQRAATAVLEIRCPGVAVKIANPVVVKTPVYNYSLEQNYPNPASGETSIRFTIPKAEKVSLAVYDINGRVVKVLVHGSRDAGTHTVSFNTGSLAGGVYYYRMRAGDFIKAKKLTIQR